MYNINLNSILTVTDFVLAFNKSEFLMSIAKAMSNTAIDSFDYLKYTYAHLALGRVQYLSDRNKNKLVPYGLLWDIAKIFSNFSCIKTTRESAFEELLKLFNLSELTQAEFTPILSYDGDSPNYNDFTLEYMRNTVEQSGFHHVKFIPLYDTLKGYLL